MTNLRTLARLVLVDAVALVSGGRRLREEERRWAEAELRLAGFRKTVSTLIVRRALGAERGTLLVTPVLDGLFRLAVGALDSGIGHAIAETGMWEPHLVAFYRCTVKSGWTVVDVGANVGFHAFHAATLVGAGGKVFAVEPDPDNAALMRTTITLQPHAPPVEVVEAALSDRDEELVLSDLGNASNSGARFTHRSRAALERQVHGSTPRFAKVRALRWDDHFGAVKVNLIKIDIEGAEPYALRGMEKTIARDRPLIVSEFAPSNLRGIGDTEPDAFLAWLRGRGYRVMIVTEPNGELAAADESALEAHLANKHHIDLACLPT